MAAQSSILTTWRQGRERERAQQRALAEQATRMADYRRHSVPVRRITPVTKAVLSTGRPAFDVVSGQRAFDAAANDRLTAGWVSWNTSINADLEVALSTLRARSRDWCVNTDMGQRWLQLVQDNVVGAKGFRLQMRALMADGVTPDDAGNQAVESAWDEWCQRHADVSGQISFVDMCRANVAAAGRDGEFLTRRIRDPRLPHGYALQLLDVDRIYPQSGAANTAQGAVMRMGVEIDSLGRRLALHLYSAHPADAQSVNPGPILLDRVPIDQLFHGYLLQRPEQLRGYPWTSSILRRADTLHGYEQAAVIAAKIGASKMGFYVTDKDAPSGEAANVEDYKAATGELIQEVEAGMLEALPPGVSFESFDPDYPHQNYDSFVTASQRAIAAGLNVAHHNLSGNMTGVNYSSARIAELAEREYWRGLQQWFIRTFVRPVFEEWLRMALLTKSITLPDTGLALPAERFAKFAAAADFQARGWGWVDPKADTDSAVTAISNNLLSTRMVCEANQTDLEDVLRDEAWLASKRKAMGLPPTPAQAQAQAMTASAGGQAAATTTTTTTEPAAP